MQREPLLLSSAKIGVPRQHITLSARDVLFAFFALIFVFYGAADLLGRVFALPVKAHSSQALTATENSTTTTEIFAAPFVPTAVIIEALGIDAPIDRVGLKPDGNMKAPSAFDRTAWYEGGARPGEAGNAVVAGHLNNALDKSGIFEHLDQIRLGDTVVVKGEGREATYVVREMSVYDADRAPAQKIFATTGPSRLVLITCDGAWDQGKRTYDKRLVVYADLISSR